MQQGVRKSELERFLADVLETTDIVERNIRTASDLVQRFKELAVTQTSEQLRSFDLRALGHVLGNLISNALHHGLDGREAGEIRVLAHVVAGAERVWACTSSSTWWKACSVGTLTCNASRA